MNNITFFTFVLEPPEPPADSPSTTNIKSIIRYIDKLMIISLSLYIYTYIYIYIYGEELGKGEMRSALMGSPQIYCFSTEGLFGCSR